MNKEIELVMRGNCSVAKELPRLAAKRTLAQKRSRSPWRWLPAISMKPAKRISRLNREQRISAAHQRAANYLAELRQSVEDAMAMMIKMLERDKSETENARFAKLMEGLQ